MKRFVWPMIGMVALLVAVIMISSSLRFAASYPEYDQGCYCMGPGYAGMDPSQVSTVTIPSTTKIPLDTSPLNDKESYWLTYMREEEKLARDVYSYHATKWNSQVLKGISDAEQNHMDIVLVALQQHKVTDPVGNNGPGVFTNPEFKTLYDKLTKQGDASLAEALRVGVTVEQKDINDLNQGLAASSHADVNDAYNALLNGSNIHLRAFNFELSKLSSTATSQPAMLTTENSIMIIVVVAALALVGAFLLRRRSGNKTAQATTP